MSPKECLGLYCGRMYSNDSGWSECGACPLGYRVEDYECRKCSQNPNIYQWLYLGFMFLLPITKQWVWILEKYLTGKKEAIAQLMSCLFENVLAIVIGLLITQPVGSLNLTSCRTDALTDWYTVFYNPKINHTKVVHCAQEAVYPFYSLVFVVYLISLVLMVLLRVWLTSFVVKKASDRKHRTRCLYKALYLYPILAATHGAGAGLAYYAYPYIMVVGSMSSLVAYMVRRQAITFRHILTSSDWRQHFTFMGWHWATLAYSIIAIGSSFNADHETLKGNLPFLAAVPIPWLFLSLTEGCTRPERIEEEPICDAL